MITVELPGLTLTNGFEDRAAAYLTDLPGWYDSANVKLRNNQRIGGHGDFDQEPVYDDARYFSVTGRIIDTSSAVLALRKTVMALKNITTQWPVSVTDPDGSRRTAMVRVAGKIQFDMSMDESVADFTIPVKAKDPRKYGAEEVLTTGLPTAGGGIVFPIVFPIDFGAAGAPGRVATTNSGEAETISTLAVTGGLGGGFSAICVELGREIRFERLIPVGSTVTVDLRTGQAFIDGQSPVSGSLTRREWWTVPPGATRTIQFNSIGAVTGTPTLTARTSPAFN